MNKLKRKVFYLLCKIVASTAAGVAVGSAMGHTMVSGY